MDNNNSIQGTPIQIPVTPAIPVPAAVNAPIASMDSMKPRRLRQKTAAELGPKAFCWGTGRRKAAIARVRLRPGSGKVIVNKRELLNFFPRLEDRNDVLAPLKATDNLDKYDVFVNVQGGGMTGQAGATKLGVARALLAAQPDTFDALRDKGYLTRDSREVERKKYGHRKARRSFQFSKR